MAAMAAVVDLTAAVALNLTAAAAVGSNAAVAFYLTVTAAVDCTAAAVINLTVAAADGVLGRTGWIILAVTYILAAAALFGRWEGHFHNLCFQPDTCASRAQPYPVMQDLCLCQAGH
eukprot:CAMPEP_0202363988 /NCGR_PEP_ID=MMETSP1126-20121109/15561_1 /ASSEMBLY_ACC=CAM_ASM_000457 /TAXON_ID=3047 /ORGANISM="Dunaliella tertiolecta, Strain CCMP1320" /LENGTH=116 /DNA_ID=CAMNT_0048958511 /DNA_START=927 /DNA_END=1277 /DNA_ORIENTATION=+